MQSLSRTLAAKAGLFVLALLILSVLIVNKPTRNLQDFDQPFYVTLAYDLDRYGVFSNGPFSDVDDTETRPPSGMFFGPVYPTLIAVVMKLDRRFADAVRCSVEANHNHRDIASCDPYDLPIRLLNSLLLAVAVVVAAWTAELLFQQSFVFAAAGGILLAALAVESEAFSYIMTESAIFSIYAVFMLATVAAWRTGLTRWFAASGLLLGLLCLTKPSYLVVFPVIAFSSVLYFRWAKSDSRRRSLRGLAVFCFGFCCVIGTWIARNDIAVGKFGFTEEYGAAVLIERLAYDDMSAREFFQAFPYCTPGLGELIFDQVYGTDSMHRFTFHTPGSFFNVGRDRRNALIAQYRRLDPLITGIVLDEMRGNWWRYLLVNIPLTWCGLWAGWVISLVLVPLFVWACIRSLRTRQPIFLIYVVPAVIMLGIDALVGNHYTRYNLILMQPYAIGSAWIILSSLPVSRWRWRPSAPAPLSAPSASGASDANSASQPG